MLLMFVIQQLKKTYWYLVFAIVFERYIVYDDDVCINNSIYPIHVVCLHDTASEHMTHVMISSIVQIYHEDSFTFAPVLFKSVLY